VTWRASAGGHTVFVDADGRPAGSATILEAAGSMARRGVKVALTPTGPQEPAALHGSALVPTLLAVLADYGPVRIEGVPAGKPSESDGPGPIF